MSDTRPLRISKQKAAKLLQVSVRTIERYLTHGVLKRSGRFVTMKSVEALGNGEIEDLEEIETEEEVEEKLKESHRPPRTRGGFVKRW